VRAMPKLTIPERTYGKAIGCLIDLYKKEPGFIEELQKIRSVYKSDVIKWLDSSVPQWRRLQAELIQARGRQDDSAKLSDFNTKLAKRFSNGVRRFYGGWNVTSELIDYEKELHDLAYRWHLKAKWSGVVLILSHINDVAGIMSEGDEATIMMPVEVIEPMLDKPPLPPLRYEVVAYELLYRDQREIIQEFTRRLSDYAKRIKSLGWKEFPSAIERHALWWFEHYVHKKEYTEIASECNPMVEAEGIKRAVFDFRKLLGMKIK